jgi:quinone-modifying oxidoreductase subunit QmoC
MSAMRNMAYQKLVPAPLPIGEWMSSAKHLPKLIAIPAIFFGLIWVLVAKSNLWKKLSASYPPLKGHGLPGNFVDGSWLPEGDIIYGKLFFGDFTIDLVFILVMLFVLFTFYKGVKNLIASLAPQGQVMFLGKKKHWTCCLVDVIFCEILPHAKFTQCGADQEKSTRKLGHMALLFAFICLAVVTGVVALGHWGGLIFPALAVHTPMPLYHPIKLLAIVGTLLLLVGLTVLTIRRKSLDPSKQKSCFYDWYLLGVIWAVGLTGLFSMLLRLANIPPLAYFVYYLHLISVFMLFAYLPWSKLGHLVYRTAVLTYVRYMGRR